MQIIDNQIILKADGQHAASSHPDKFVDSPTEHTVSRISKKAFFCFGSAALCAIMAGFVGWTTSLQPEPPPVAAAVVAVKPHVFDDIRIEAKAAYVYDPTTGETMYERNADAQLPLASLTKIMLALVAQKYIPKDVPIVVSAESLAQDGDSGLQLGEHWELSKLLDLTLVVSSNDGADAIARAAAPFLDAAGSSSDPVATTVSRMNLEAKSLGLIKTYFLNPTGLDISTSQSGAYGSARDVAHLLSHVIADYPGLLDATAKNGVLVASDESEHSAKNTNQALDKIPGLIGGKTGYTDLAEGNLAVAFDLGVGHPVIAVVLGSSYEGRFSDMQTLVKTAQAYALATAR